MRITGGAARGIELKSPPGDRTRPATDKLRLALFSSLGPEPLAGRFIDLFAGTGSYGLEAWSRGAAGGLFIERHRPTAAILLGNLEAVARSARRPINEVAAICADSFSPTWQQTHLGSAAIVFADPPYGDLARAWPRLFLLADQLLAPEGGLLVVEAPADFFAPPAPGWYQRKRVDGGGGLPTALVLARGRSG